MKKVEKGTVTFAISAINPLKLINDCTENDICLYQSRQSDDGLIISVKAEEARRLMRIVRQNHGKIKILKKEGWIFSWLKIRKKSGLFWGLLLAVSLLYLLLGYIWSYEVSGNERYSDEEVIAMVKKYGICRGVPKSNLCLEDTAEEILHDYNGEISWIWLGTHGTVLEVRIKEMERTELDYDKAADIVSNKDALVLDILPLVGEARVKAGDEVFQGEILIKGVEYDNWQKNDAGLYVPKDAGRALRAEGRVSGAVLYENYAAVSLKEHYFIAPYPSQRGCRLYKNEREIWASDENTPSLEKIIWQKKWNIGRDSWCLQLRECTAQILAEREYTPVEAYKTGAERVQKYKERFLAGDIIKNEQSMAASGRENVVLLLERVWRKEDLARIRIGGEG